MLWGSLDVSYLLDITDRGGGGGDGAGGWEGGLGGSEAARHNSHDAKRVAGSPFQHGAWLVSWKQFVLRKICVTSAAKMAQTMDPMQEDSRNFRMPMTFDGKRMRKAVLRKTVDYNASVIKQIQVSWPRRPDNRQLLLCQWSKSFNHFNGQCFTIFKGPFQNIFWQSSHHRSFVMTTLTERETYSKSVQQPCGPLQCPCPAVKWTP